MSFKKNVFNTVSVQTQNQKRKVNQFSSSKQFINKENQKNVLVTDKRQKTTDNLKKVPHQPNFFKKVQNHAVLQSKQENKNVDTPIHTSISEKNQEQIIKKEHINEIEHLNQTDNQTKEQTIENKFDCMELTKAEKRVIDAVNSFKDSAVRKIMAIKKEYGNRLAKLVRPDIRDSNGLSLCHLAARSGATYVIEFVLYNLNANYQLTDKNGNEPPSYSWNGNYTSKLEEYIKRNKFIEEYNQHLNKISIWENENDSYYNGIIFTRSLELKYNSKNPQKSCAIPDKDLMLHTRQAIDEMFIVSTRYKKWENGNCLKKKSFNDNQLKNLNFLIVNIGFVMSKNYEKPSKTPHEFISMPFNNDFQNDLSRNKKSQGHSEENLYDFLLYEKNLKHVLMQFINFIKADKESLSKLYTAVIDLHSSQDMCENCERITYSFQNEFVNLVKKIAEDPHEKLVLGKNFKLTVRMSSSREPSSNEYRYHWNSKVRDPSFTKPLARYFTYENPLDVKNSGANVILHDSPMAGEERGKNSYDYNWLKREINISNVPPRTCFVNGSSPKFLFFRGGFPTNYHFKNNEEKVINNREKLNFSYNK